MFYMKMGNGIGAHGEPQRRTYLRRQSFTTEGRVEQTSNATSGRQITSQLYNWKKRRLNLERQISETPMQLSKARNSSAKHWQTPMLHLQSLR